jgi:hypothetical protein
MFSLDQARRAAAVSSQNSDLKKVSGGLAIPGLFPTFVHQMPAGRGAEASRPPPGTGKSCVLLYTGSPLLYRINPHRRRAFPLDFTIFFVYDV